jgi:hypothetical protein
MTDGIPLAAGDSLEQREAELLLLALLGKRLGVRLIKRRFPVPDGKWLEIDGTVEEPPVLCEAWAHQGPAKGGQKHKVMTDAFRLLYASKFLPKPPRLILLFGDSEAAAQFQGTSWMAQVLRANGIDVVVVDLPEEVKRSLREAQRRQFR